jgi:hypothetical protein
MLADEARGDQGEVTSAVGRPHAGMTSDSKPIVIIPVLGGIHADCRRAA